MSPPAQQPAGPDASIVTEATNRAEQAEAAVARVRALLQPIGCDPDCESGPGCDGWDHVVSFKIRDCVRKAYAVLADPQPPTNPDLVLQAEARPPRSH